MRKDTRRPHRIYIHVGWSTLGRLPLLPRDLRGAVELCLISLCRRLDAEPLAVRALNVDASAPQYELLMDLYAQMGDEAKLVVVALALEHETTMPFGVSFRQGRI